MSKPENQKPTAKRTGLASLIGNFNAEDRKMSKIETEITPMPLRDMLDLSEKITKDLVKIDYPYACVSLTARVNCDTTDAGEGLWMSGQYRLGRRPEPVEVLIHVDTDIATAIKLTERALNTLKYRQNEFDASKPPTVLREEVFIPF